MLPWMWNCIFSLFFMHLKFVRKFQYFWMDQVGFGFSWWCEAMIQIPVSGILFWCKLVSFYFLCCLWNDVLFVKRQCFINRSTRTDRSGLVKEQHIDFVRLSSGFSIYNSLLLLGHLTSVQPIFSYINYFQRLVFMSAPLSMFVFCRNNTAVPGSQQEFACRSMMALQWLLFSISPWVLTIFCSSTALHLQFS